MSHETGKGPLKAREKTATLDGSQTVGLDDENYGYNESKRCIN